MSFLAHSKQTTTETFQLLKPLAVDLSQAVLHLHASSAKTSSIEDPLEALSNQLKVIIDQGRLLDTKLADYVFFPVSQVLKLSQKVSIRCLELSLNIIELLVQYGWKHDIKEQLAQQLLILCTLLAEQKPKLAQGGQTTPDLQQNALQCLEQILIAAAASSNGTTFIISDANIPQFGQTVTVVLQALQIPHPQVQSAACNAIAAISQLDLPSAVFWNFLPGIISTLTKVLTFTSTQRRRPDQLITCLESLGRFLQSGFGDAQEVDTQSMETATSQIRLALNNIVRLQSHDRVDVKQALGKLCLLLLRQCRKSLQSCVEVALETLLALSVDFASQTLHFELVMLMTMDTTLLAAVQAILYSWSQSMVRLMQGADDGAKDRRLQQISSAYRCMVDAGIDLTTTNQLMLRTMRDCVLLVVQDSKQPAEPAVPSVSSLQLVNITKTSSTSQDFSSLTTSTAQSRTMQIIRSLATQLATATSLSSNADELICTLQTSQGYDLVASFWLLLQQLRSATQDTLDLDSMIDVDDLIPAEQIDEAYSFGLSYLGNQDQLPLISSLSLQALALKAQTTGPNFKYELVDALYPVLHALATPHDLVQHDSIVTLNIFTKVCGYGSVKELIVDNVDYLTNAVSLKLNAFDISPQAPQVLLMMVKLAGPSLVPYLEDIIDSIFAALEDYHGYPLLVELLFKTLTVIADEGRKAPLLAPEQDKLLQATETAHQTSIADLAMMIRDRSQPIDIPNATEDAGPTPQKPWTNEDDEMAPAPADEPEAPPPAPKTYNTLVKITELTQHFLSSASPSLRISLLGLINTTIPAIAKHDNTFLPLINTLWPEVVSRLYDDEPSVRTAALEIITVLCKHAKDFMRSRIVDLWPQIKTIWRDLMAEFSAAPSKTRADSTSLALSKSMLKDVQRVQAGPEDYSNTSIRMQWHALVSMLLEVIRTVPVTPQMFDDALQMTLPELNRAEVLQVFQMENADAVWLVQLQQQKVSVFWQPLTDYGFVALSQPLDSTNVY